MAKKDEPQDLGKETPAEELESAPEPAPAPEPERKGPVFTRGPDGRLVDES